MVTNICGRSENSKLVDNLSHRNQISDLRGGNRSRRMLVKLKKCSWLRGSRNNAQSHYGDLSKVPR